MKSHSEPLKRRTDNPLCPLSGDVPGGPLKRRGPDRFDAVLPPCVTADTVAKTWGINDGGRDCLNVARLPPTCPARRPTQRHRLIGAESVRSSLTSAQGLRNAGAESQIAPTFLGLGSRSCLSKFEVRRWRLLFSAITQSMTSKFVTGTATLIKHHFSLNIISSRSLSTDAC